MRLTEFGEAFLPKAETVLRELEGARRTIDDLQDDVRGKLTVGVIPTVMPDFLTPHLADFATQCPNVELHLTEDVTARLLERLQVGELDLVVASLSTRNPDLLWSELFRDAICLVVSPTHLLASASVAEWTALESERLLILKDGHCFRDQILRLADEAAPTLGPSSKAISFPASSPWSHRARRKHHPGDGRIAGQWVLRHPAGTSECS